VGLWTLVARNMQKTRKEAEPVGERKILRIGDADCRLLAQPSSTCGWARDAIDMAPRLALLVQTWPRSSLVICDHVAHGPQQLVVTDVDVDSMYTTHCV